MAALPTPVEAKVTLRIRTLERNPMVKKLQKMADKKKAAAATGFPAGLLDSAMAQNVKDSAQQIWAAGLASFAKAQGEGSKVFEALVSEGLKLQKKTQSAAEEKLSAVASKVSGVAGEVGAKAGQQWDKLESIFEARVAKALQGLGVPTKRDIDALIKRIDALAAATGVEPAKKTAPKAAKKPAAKPAAKAAAKPAPVAKKAAPAPAKKAGAAKPAVPAKKAAPAPAKKAPAAKKAAAPKAAAAPAAPKAEPTAQA
jgi:poly(hydroxyalkanoate) granule-associated protein